MRKLIYSTYATLDGKVDDLQEWVTPWDEAAVAAYHEDLLTNSDGLLCGRTTFQVFSMIWPAREQEHAYAARANRMPKYVVSSSLTDDDMKWENSQLLKGDVKEAVAKLKEEDGRDLVTYGGPGLVYSLQEHDLIDEYRILLHPILLGKGRGYIKDGLRADLELVDSSIVTTGVALLTYRRAGR